MKIEPSAPPIDDQNEQFELAFRLIERYDHHLDSLESRAATIISADALLLAGTTFLVDKILLHADKFSLTQQIFIGISIGISLTTLALSIIYAATTIANVMRTTRKIVGGIPPQTSLFFSSTDTVRALKEFSVFKKHFQTSSKEQLLSYALSELWLITNLRNRRQKNFRWAVRLLLLSVVPFLTAYAILIIN